MGVYRTALGKQVDMSALVAKNEKTRAVGNMKVNARGDTIDSHGRVIIPVTEKVNNNYSKTVGKRQQHTTRRTTIQPDTNKTVELNSQTEVKTNSEKVSNEELTSFEKELEDNLQEDLFVEEIKKKELGKNNER